MPHLQVFIYSIVNSLSSGPRVGQMIRSHQIITPARIMRMRTAAAWMNYEKYWLEAFTREAAICSRVVHILISTG